MLNGNMSLEWRGCCHGYSLIVSPGKCWTVNIVGPVALALHLTPACAVVCWCRVGLKQLDESGLDHHRPERQDAEYQPARTGSAWPYWRWPRSAHPWLRGGAHYFGLSVPPDAPRVKCVRP
jgi:hypothetical protein